MTPIPPIPEDLQELYAKAIEFQAGVAYSIGHLPKTGNAVQLTALIERIAKLTAEVELLKEEIEDRKNGDLMDQEEFEDICGSENVTPSDCCKPKYCRLAPFHEIKLLRAENTRLKAPVSDEEWAPFAMEHACKSGVIARQDFDYIIEARATRTPPQEGQ